MDEEKITLDKGIDTIEGIEAHYAKIYSDLPEEVVRMLISTHPIYGSDREVAKNKPKDFVLETETLAKPKDKEIDKYEETTEDEKEYMSALFSEKDDINPKTDFKKYIILGMYLAPLLVLLVLSIFGFSQNSTNKAKVAQSEADNVLLTKQLNAIETEKNILVEKNTTLTKEIEQLKTDISSSEDNTSSNATVGTTAGATAGATIEPTTKPTTKPTTTATNKKTYKVVAGDTLWGISEKIYGTGKYNVDIMKANNIQGDISVGMTLILPDIQGGN